MCQFIMFLAIMCQVIMSQVICAKLYVRLKMIKSCIDMKNVQNHR